MFYRNYLGSNNESYSRIPNDVTQRNIDALNLDRNEDYLWYSTAHAEAYIAIHVCGRQAILEMERKGLNEDYMKSSFNQFYRFSEMAKMNQNAHWWGLIFSPMIENESKPKIWIRFPNEEKVVWYFIDGFDKKKGLILSPDPRKPYTMNYFAGYEKEFQEITSCYPKTIEHARNESYEIFKANEIQKPARSGINERIGLLVYPFPEHKSGDRVRYGGGPKGCYDKI